MRYLKGTMPNINSMTRYFYVVILLLSFSYLKANPKYEEIDRVSKSVPDTLSTPQEIAEYLTLKLDKDDEKVRALHIWITHNIKYDETLLSSDITYSSYDELVVETIKNKKGVCYHYAQLFHTMCESIGIESHVISGYTQEKNSDVVPKISHAWNVVNVESSYAFIDNTWASGYADYKGNYIQEFVDEYFLIPPKDFIKTHVPFDPIWQFLDNPVNNIDIKNKDFSKLEIIGNFNSKDSISEMVKLDEITRLKKKINRIEKSGITNVLIQRYVNQCEEQIENQIYRNWVSMFNNLNNKVNSAKDEMNIGIGFNNVFIDYMNKRFRNPKIEDDEIKSTIDKANLHFFEGKNQLNQLKKLVYELEFDGSDIERLEVSKKSKKELLDFIIDIEHKILEVEPSVLKNTDYAKRYLKKWKPLRDLVPYEN